LLDVVRERKPRFVPAQVIAEFAELLKAYRITSVLGDKYAVGFHAAEWKNHGIEFVPCERTTSENYLSLLPLLLAQRVRLLDNMTLRQQLAALVRRVGAGNHETVAHAPTASAHDDVATAAAGALVAAAQRPGYSLDGGAFDLPGEAGTRPLTPVEERLRIFAMQGGVPAITLRDAIAAKEGA
jgi:hypothetical protein